MYVAVQGGVRRKLWKCCGDGECKRHESRVVVREKNDRPFYWAFSDEIELFRDGPLR